ncbi:MAG: helix-turn-helix transcriptional regulator [Coriobacteriia bacterium]|nr:helix-turn-helix transcriptional regulator [Coriobacteriia bacterium]
MTPSQTPDEVPVVPDSVGPKWWMPIRYLGLSFIMTWIWLTSSSTLLFPTAESPVALARLSYTVSLGVDVVVLLAVGLFFTRPISSSQRKILLIFSPLLVAVGTATIALVGASAGDSLSMVVLLGAAALTGVGNAPLLLMCGEFYGSIGTKRASIYIPAAFALAIALYFVVVNLRPVAAIIALAALPLCAAGVLALSLLRIPAAIPILRAHSTRVFPIPWRLSLAIGLYGAAFGLMQGLILPGSAAAFNSTYAWSLLGGGIAAVLITLGSILFSRDLDLGFTYRPVLPLLVVGFLLLPFLGGSRSYLAGAAVTAGYVCFDILVWIMLSDLANRSGISPLKVFGCGRGLAQGSMLIGMLLGYLFAGRIGVASEGLTWVAVGAVIALVLLTSIVLSARDVLGAWGLEEANALSAPDEDLLMLSYHEISERAALTRREREVMELLAKGRSLAYIEGKLVIAHGTAKTHVYRIYNKLGVHSRQELIDMVESSIEWHRNS